MQIMMHMCKKMKIANDDVRQKAVSTRNYQSAHKKTSKKVKQQPQ